MSDLAAPKQRGRPFKPGQSGNVNGKPPGARHAALLALDAIAHESGQDIMQAVVLAAKAGDMRAAEILLRRIWPERKGRPVLLTIPSIKEPSDIVAALAAITGAVSAGELSPDEGASIAGILETQRRAVETVELERRLAAVEQSIVGRGQ